MSGFARTVGLLAPSLLAAISTASGAGCPAKPAAALVVALDVGHHPKQPGQACSHDNEFCYYGVTSARGVAEYDFNLKLAEAIKEELVRAGFQLTYVMPPLPALQRSDVQSALGVRLQRARALHADIFISVHHDGVTNRFMTPWIFEGRKNWYYDQAGGFSLHVSPANAKYGDSLGLARAIADELMAQGLHFSTVHEPGNPAGARAPYIDASRGIYRRDNLAVLRYAAMPAILLEAGTIVNRDEEIEVSTPAYRSKVAAAVAAAISRYCGAAPLDATYQSPGRQK